LGAPRNDVPRALLDLAVQWRELAAQIARLQWDALQKPSAQFQKLNL